MIVSLELYRSSWDTLDSSSLTNLVSQRNYLGVFFKKFFMEIRKNVSQFFVSNRTNFGFKREFGHDFYVSSAKVSIQFMNK